VCDVEYPCLEFVFARSDDVLFGALVHNARVSAGMKRKAEVIYRDLEFIRRGLDRFTLPVLSHLSKIDKYAPTAKSSGSGPRPKNSISDPVGNAVANQVRINDPVGQTIKGIDSSIAELVRDVEILIQKLDYVLDPSRRIPVEAQIPECSACNRKVMATASDRLRSGYCFSCYRKWLGLGKPLRGAFEAQIRGEMLEDENP